MLRLSIIVLYYPITVYRSKIIQIQTYINQSSL